MFQIVGMVSFSVDNYELKTSEYDPRSRMLVVATPTVLIQASGKVSFY